MYTTYQPANATANTSRNDGNVVTTTEDGPPTTPVVSTTQEQVPLRPTQEVTCDTNTGLTDFSVGSEGAADTTTKATRPPYPSKVLSVKHTSSKDKGPPPGVSGAKGLMSRKGPVWFKPYRPTKGGLRPGRGPLLQ